MSIIDKIRWMGVPTGQWGTNQKVIKSGSCTIPAGQVSVLAVHGFSQIPFVTQSCDQFVFLKNTPDATNILFEIDAPQIVDTVIRWSATL